MLTSDVGVNITRIKAREALGGHGVQEEKIRLRYERALKLIPQLVEVCDVLHIYDNTDMPFRIFKKRKNLFYRWRNQFWTDTDIEMLTGIRDYTDKHNQASRTDFLNSSPVLSYSVISTEKVSKWFISNIT